MIEENSSINPQYQFIRHIDKKLKSLIRDPKDLSLIYAPTVSSVHKEITAATDKDLDLDIKTNTIAIVTDGSDVLDLGNVGPQAALPLMEAKAAKFKEYANINAFPICLNTQNVDEILHILKNIIPIFAGVNLEDIAISKSLEIERSLTSFGVPVFGDDQHGTAIVLLAALHNAALLAGKQINELKVVINGVKPHTYAITNLLLCNDHESQFQPVNEIIICDEGGILNQNREDLFPTGFKKKLSQVTNRNQIEGGLDSALQDADVLINLEKNAILDEMTVKYMADKPIIFALSEANKQLDPFKIHRSGFFVLSSLRDDLPNRLDNSLVYPGLFKGALNAKANRITNAMKIQAAYSLAESVEGLAIDRLLPDSLDKQLSMHMADAVSRAYETGREPPSALTN